MDAVVVRHVLVKMIMMMIMTIKMMMITIEMMKMMIVRSWRKMIGCAL